MTIKHPYCSSVLEANQVGSSTALGAVQTYSIWHFLSQRAYRSDPEKVYNKTVHAVSSVTVAMRTTVPPIVIQCMEPYRHKGLYTRQLYTMILLLRLYYGSGSQGIHSGRESGFCKNPCCLPMGDGKWLHQFHRWTSPAAQFQPGLHWEATREQ